MSRSQWICLLAMLLLSSIAPVFAEGGKEPAQLLADLTETLEFSNSGNSKSFFYEDGIKFTAVFPPDCSYAEFKVSFDGCNLEFSWETEKLFFKGTKKGVSHEGKNVSVEISNGVKLNGKPVGDVDCAEAIKKGQKVEVKAKVIGPSGSTCNLKLEFKCRDYFASTTPPPLQKNKENKEVQTGGVSWAGQHWYWFVIGAVVLLLLIASGIGIFCILRRRRQSSSGPTQNSEAPNVVVDMKQQSTEMESAAKSNKPAETQTTDMKTGIQKTPLMKTGVQKTGDMKTGVQKSDDLTPIKPRLFTLDTQRQRIADGARVGPHENKTMDDVKSNWFTVDQEKKSKKKTGSASSIIWKKTPEDSISHGSASRTAE